MVYSTEMGKSMGLVRVWGVRVNTREVQDNGRYDDR